MKSFELLVYDSAPLAVPGTAESMAAEATRRGQHYLQSPGASLLAVVPDWRKLSSIRLRGLCKSRL